MTHGSNDKPCTQPGLTMRTSQIAHGSRLIEMTFQARFVDRGGRKFSRVADVAGRDSLNMFASRSVARLTRAAFPTDPRFGFNGIVRAFHERVEDVLVTCLAGCGTYIVRGRTRGDLRHPEEQRQSHKRITRSSWNEYFGSRSVACLGIDYALAGRAQPQVKSLFSRRLSASPGR